MVVEPGTKLLQVVPLSNEYSSETSGASLVMESEIVEFDWVAVNFNPFSS